MLGRSAALALATLVIPSLAIATEFPVPEIILWSAASSITAPAPPVPASTLLPEPGALPVARLVWLDPAGIAHGVEAIAKPEVVEILRGMGIAASWRRGDASELARPGELRVIFLNRPGTNENGMPVLGATPTELDGELHVWVHVPSVAEAVGIERLRPDTTLDLPAAHRLGLGLARVVAHETVHALAPGLKHGKGLMSARLDRRMLTAPKIAVDPNVSFAVRTALQGPRRKPQAPDTLLAAETIREEPE
jgi:hypothetical protein